MRMPNCRIKTVTMLLKDKPLGDSFLTKQGTYRITNLYPITNFNDNCGVFNHTTYVRYTLINHEHKGIK